MPRPRKAALPRRKRLMTKASMIACHPGTENYLLCLYRLWEDDEYPTITQLTDVLRRLPPTEGLGTSVPSVAGMVRRMARQRLVEVGTDKRIRLTRQGMEGGEDIARRHRLAEWMVVQVAGNGVAPGPQRGASPGARYVAAADGKAGGTAGQPQALSLRASHTRYGRAKDTGKLPELGFTAVKGRSYVVERVPEEDSQLLKFLDDSQIVPEREISVADATPFLGVMEVATQQGQVSMSYAVAHQIVVRPACMAPESPETKGAAPVSRWQAPFFSAAGSQLFPDLCPSFRHRPVREGGRIIVLEYTHQYEHRPLLFQRLLDAEQQLLEAVEMVGAGVPRALRHSYQVQVVKFPEWVLRRWRNGRHRRTRSGPGLTAVTHLWWPVLPSWCAGLRRNPVPALSTSGWARARPSPTAGARSMQSIRSRSRSRRSETRLHSLRAAEVETTTESPRW